MKQARLRIGLRAKLFLVALSLLSIPWIGYRYVVEMHDFLRENEEGVLLEHARIVAAALSERESYFEHTRPQVGDGSDHFFVRPLRAGVQLDGYSDDWASQRDRQLPLNYDDGLLHDPRDISATVSLGSYAKELYLLVEVRDDAIVYRDPSNKNSPRADRLEVWLYDAQKRLLRLTLTSSAPGWVDVLVTNERGKPVRDSALETAVRGEWQETAGGYNVELRVPITRVEGRIGLRLVDVDRVNGADEASLTIGRRKGTTQLGTVAVVAPEVEAMLSRWVRPGMRAWVVDNSNRVIGLAGGFDEPTLAGENTTVSSEPENSLWETMYQIILRLLLQQPAIDFPDDLSGASRLDGSEMVSALAGRPATRWRAISDQRVNILTAAYPIRIGDEIVGAAAVEETSNSILLVRNRAMEMLINLSVVAFLIAAISTLFLATRLSVRIRNLNREMQAAIGPQGKLESPLVAQSTNDELGDLRNGFSQLLDRLRHYHVYLEGLARKLSHELRTPMTVVRSSLDNLTAGGVSGSGQIYLTRAQEGVRRLDAIVTRMSEASRLEQAVRCESTEVFEAVEVVRGCVDGYTAMGQDLALDFHAPTWPVYLRGNPDLFAQMLDKLISNARDFHVAGSKIEIVMLERQAHLTLSIANEGPPLPADAAGRLFESMFSARTQPGDEPHLGLGLYIVRLVCEFHGGRVVASNRERPPGVVFALEFPVEEKASKR